MKTGTQYLRPPSTHHCTSLWAGILSTGPLCRAPLHRQEDPAPALNVQENEGHTPKGKPQFTMEMVRQKCVSASPLCIYLVQLGAHLCHLSCLVPHIQTHFCPAQTAPSVPMLAPKHHLVSEFSLKHSRVRGEARWVEDSWGTISLSPVATTHHSQVGQKPRHPPHLLLLPVRLLGHQGLLISLLQS